MSNQAIKGSSSFSALLHKNRVLILVGAALFLLAFVLRALNLSSSPDVFGDEALYTNIAVTLPQYGHLEAFGSPWFVHPPLYYIFQSGFFQLTGIRSVTLANVFTGRYTSVLYSSLAVVAVFVWITKISDIGIGALTAVVLTIEPYALKYSRIGILESLVMLFAIIALYFFANANSRPGLKNYVLGGVFFGLALLTKELAVFLIVVIAVWLLLTRYIAKSKVNVKGTTVFLVTGLLMFLAYVIWALSIDASVFLNTYYTLLERSLWIVRDTGYTSANYVSFTSDFISNANLYLMTYLMLGLAAVASVYFILKERNNFTLLLSSWFIGSAIFFSAIGIHNPQFLVYVTVPAAVISGYIISEFVFGPVRRNKKVIFAAVLLLFVIIGYNMEVWAMVDGGNDTAFSQSITWLQANVPKGQNILTSDSAYSYFLINYRVYSTLNTMNAIQGFDIHYYILLPRFDYYLSQNLIVYIQTNGRLLASFSGQSTGEIYVYYIEDPV